MNSRVLLSLAALAWSAGCATGDGLEGEFGGRGDEGGGGDRGLDERLRDRVSLSVASGEDGASAVHLTAASLTDEVSVAVELRVTGGTVTVSLEPDGAAGERLVFHDLALSAEDVEVASSIVPPRGLLLTGLSMQLQQEVSAELEWHTADGLGAEGALSVDVQWAVELDSGTVDLAPIRLTSVPLEITVEETGDGRLTGHLHGTTNGAFWSWAGIFELRDLELDLFAASE